MVTTFGSTSSSTVLLWLRVRKYGSTTSEYRYVIPLALWPQCTSTAEFRKVLRNLRYYYNIATKYYPVMARIKKVQSTRKPASRAPQVKLSEKHHWYFEKKNATSKDYAEIISAFFPDGGALSDKVQYAIVSYCFEAARNDRGFDVCATVKGFIQLASPVKCTKDQFFDMFGIDVNAYEPDDLIYTTPESCIQPDSFRMMVLCHSNGFKEGGDIRKRGPKVTTEMEPVSQAEETKTEETKTEVNFSNDLLTDWTEFLLPTKKKNDIISNATGLQMKRSDSATSQEIPLIASPSVAVGRGALATTSGNSSNFTDRRGLRRNFEMLTSAVSPSGNMDNRKKAARTQTRGSPHGDGLTSPLGSTLLVSSNGKRASMGATQSPTNSGESSVMDDKQKKKEQLRLLFPDDTEESLDHMLLARQTGPMSIPSAEEREENDGAERKIERKNAKEGK